MNQIVPTTRIQYNTKARHSVVINRQSPRESEGNDHKLSTTNSLYREIRAVLQDARHSAYRAVSGPGLLANRLSDYGT